MRIIFNSGNGVDMNFFIFSPHFNPIPIFPSLSLFYDGAQHLDGLI